MSAAAATDELLLIRRFMEDAQRITTDRGGHFMSWGAIVAAALLLTYFDIRGWVTVPVAALWGGALLLAWLCSFAIARRDEARARVRTAAGRVHSAIWMASGVSMTLIALAALLGNAVPLPIVSGLVATILGTASFATSFLIRGQWLRIVAVAWWAAGLVMLVRPGEYVLPLLAALLLGLQVVPGWLLHSFARKEHGLGAHE